MSWSCFVFPFSSSSYYLSPTALLSDLSMWAYEKENVCVLFLFPIHLLRLSPLPAFTHSVKERAYVVPPEVFLITTGAEIEGRLVVCRLCLQLFSGKLPTSV